MAVFKSTTIVQSVMFYRAPDQIRLFAPQCTCMQQIKGETKCFRRRNKEGLPTLSASGFRPVSVQAECLRTGVERFRSWQLTYSPYRVFY